MLIVTSESIAGKRIVRTLGLVKGSTVRARHIGHDIIAGLKNLIGGEIREYGKLVAEAREQSLDRMVDDARAMGANAVITMRFLDYRDDGWCRRNACLRHGGCGRRHMIS